MAVPEAPDAEALAIAHLGAHPRIRELAALLDPEDPESAANVGTDVVGPFPMLQVVQTPVNARAGVGGPQWLDAPELAVSAWDAPPGSDGAGVSKPALRELAYAAVNVLAELPDREVGEEDPVVTTVRRTYGPSWLPDQATQQPRYAAGVVLYLHPPRS